MLYEMIFSGLPKGKAMTLETIPIRYDRVLNFSDERRRRCSQESISKNSLMLSAIPNARNSKTDFQPHPAAPSNDSKKCPTFANEAN